MNERPTVTVINMTVDLEQTCREQAWTIQALLAQVRKQAAQLRELRGQAAS